MERRPYQLEAAASVERSFQRGYNSALSICFTGGGKTIISHDVIKNVAPISEKRTLFLVSWQDLVWQTRRAFYRYSPDWKERKWTTKGRPGIGVVMGNTDQPDGRIIVGTPQTLGGSDKKPDLSRLQRVLDYGQIDLIVIDEAHRSVTKQFIRIIEAVRAHNPAVKIAGFTATPWREDGLGLNNIFDVIACNFNLQYAIRNNYACQIRDPLQIETHVHLPDSADTDEDMAKAIEVQNWAEIVLKGYLEHGENRLSLAFMPSVEHSRNFARYAQSQGVECAHVDSDGVIMPNGQEMGTKQRYAIYEWYAGPKDPKKPRILTNYNILTTGFDCPPISCLLWARPTKSDLVFMQCLSTDTEILTKDNGWATHRQVKKGDVIATLNPKTGGMEWQAVTDTVFRPVAPSEKMVSYEGIHVNFRVTEGHRMLHSPRVRHERGGRFELPTFTTAGELAGKSEFSVPVSAQMDFPGVNLSDDELRLLGFWLADGTQFGRRSGRTTPQDRFEITQSNHRAAFSALQNIIQKCGFLCQVIPNPHGKHTQFSSRGLRHTFRLLPDSKTQYIAGYRPWSKLIPFMDKDIPDVYDLLTRDQWQKVLEGLHLGDGSKVTGADYVAQTYTIVGKGKEYADRLQELSVLRGLSCNIAKDGKNTFRVRIKDASHRHIVGTAKPDRDSMHLVDPLPDEHVWCVSVPNQTIVTRRKGKPIIMGNCLGRGTRLDPSKEDLLILDYVVEGMKLVSASSITGLALESSGETAEKEEEELAEGTDTRDAAAKKGESYVTGEGVKVKIGKLIGHSKNSWWCNAQDNTMSLACGEDHVLFVVPPYYTLARRIEEGMEVGEQALEKDPDNIAKQGFYAHLERAQEVFNNYTVWKISRDGTRWKLYERPLLVDDNPMALFDRLAAIEDQLIGDDAVLSKKHRQWRRKPASDKQLELLRRLGCRELPDNMGNAAQCISHFMAAPKVEKHLEQIRKNCKIFGVLDSELAELNREKGA